MMDHKLPANTEIRLNSCFGAAPTEINATVASRNIRLHDLTHESFLKSQRPRLPKETTAYNLTQAIRQRMNISIFDRAKNFIKGTGSTVTAYPGLVSKYPVLVTHGPNIHTRQLALGFRNTQNGRTTREITQDKSFAIKKHNL